MVSQYEQLVTGRTESLFHQDMETHQAALRGALDGSRIAIVGAAGSIGSAVVKTILRFRPSALALIDLSENNLVELVRDLRSTDGLSIPDDFTTLAIGLGSVEFSRYFRDQPPFDYFLNLSALKHVRSEKNVYSLMRMVDVNVLCLHEFLADNPYQFRKVFSVSSDKAANPASLMGATKMAMERVLLLLSEVQPFSTARFANVAFSDGSLPFGFIHRVNKRQPIAAPNDVRRYFISHQEAGELCVLSAALGNNRDVFFPKLETGQDEKTFVEIATAYLHSLGYEPVPCATEDEARRRTDELIGQKKWPCHFFKSDTTGEKEYEEFYLESEKLDFDRFKRVGAILRPGEMDPKAVERFITFAQAARENPKTSKADYVQALATIVPGLQHQETGRNLDQKM